MGEAPFGLKRLQCTTAFVILTIGGLLFYSTIRTVPTDQLLRPSIAVWSGEHAEEAATKNWNSVSTSRSTEKLQHGVCKGFLTGRKG